MRIYLSVDLDYWEEGDRKWSDDLYHLADSIISRDIPWKLVTQHDHLLPHINRIKFDKLINVDAHADLADISESMYLNEGTWGNYVSGRTKREFLWVHRRGRESSGRCDAFEGHLEFHQLDTSWKKQSRSVKHWASLFDWKDVVAVGVSISPDWSDERVVGTFFAAAIKYGLLERFQVIPR